MRKGSDWYRRPEMILSDILRKGARDDLVDQNRILLRAVVLAVDPVGGALENEQGIGSFNARGSDGRTIKLNATIGPSNPVGSVKARVLTDGLDRIRQDQEVRTFWPLHPQEQLSVPISPGEHVYVMFEDGNALQHGLWLSRVSGQDSGGVFLGTDSYTAPAAPTSAMDSFEPNGPTGPTDDASASMAPAKDAMGLFEGED